MQGRWTTSAIFSVNCFAAAMLALFIGFAVGLPVPYWAMTTAYIVSNPLAGPPAPRRPIAWLAR